MKNNISEKNMALCRVPLNCPGEDCTLFNPFYAGNTLCTLAQRITNPLQCGAFRTSDSSNCGPQYCANMP